MATSATTELQIEIRDRVGVLTMNRPDKLNAFTLDMMNAGIATLTDWARNPEVGCVVVTGTGRAFSAGGDVGAMQRGDELAAKESTIEDQIEGLRHWHQFPALLHSIPKATIAVVNGIVVGGGLGVALSCDLRFAADTAQLGTAYANVGYGGDFGTTWGLTRLVGEAKAKELFFLPDLIDAAEAHRIGLFNRVFPADSLMEEAMALATRIAHGPLTSYRYMKANVSIANMVDHRTMLDRESESHIRCGQTHDHQEGVNAFLEKRAPKFTGT